MPEQSIVAILLALVLSLGVITVYAQGNETGVCNMSEIEFTDIQCPPNYNATHEAVE